LPHQCEKRIDMNRRMVAFGAFIAMCLMAGCRQPESQTLPTIAPSAAPNQVATSTAAATLPPTEPPLDRPTLPPTWTASPPPTQPPTATIDVAAQSAKPTLVACGGFAADRERSDKTFTPGNPVQVFWTAVDTAARYRISLIDDQGNELFMDYALQPSYIFKGD